MSYINTSYIHTVAVINFSLVNKLPDAAPDSPLYPACPHRSITLFALISYTLPDFKYFDSALSVYFIISSVNKSVDKNFIELSTLSITDMFNFTAYILFNQDRCVYKD